MQRHASGSGCDITHSRDSTQRVVTDRHPYAANVELSELGDWITNRTREGMHFRVHANCCAFADAGEGADRVAKNVGACIAK